MKKLLPSLRAADGVHVGPAERQALARLLRTRDTDLAIAVLHALELFGDAAALLTVHSLADGHGAGRNACVRQAATNCLTALRAKAEQNWQSLTLLRPAETTATEALVRPAGHSVEEPELLVRPAHREE